MLSVYDPAGTSWHVSTSRVAVEMYTEQKSVCILV